MTVAIRGRLCVASSCRINHFGINPVRGGRPPSDNITRAVVIVRVGFLDQTTASVLMFVAEETLRVRKAADVMKIYIISARRVSWGAYWRTISIQPMCAIEE